MTDVESGDGVAFVVRGDVALVLWQGPARLARGRWTFERLEREIASRRDFCLMQIILPSSSPPDGEMRAESKLWLGRWADRIRLLVTVPVGDALWTNIVRTIMRAMVLVQGRGTNHVVADSIHDGIRKVLDAKTTITPSRDTLEAAARALLLALGEDPALAAAPSVAAARR